MKTIKRFFGSFEILTSNVQLNTSQRQVPFHIKKPDYSAINSISKKQIIINSSADIEGITQASQIAKKVLDIGCRYAQEGITTEEIDRILHDAIIKENAYPSPLGYMGFPKSICTSVNNVLCHGIPDKRKLKDGDLINIDVTVYYKGYHGDTSKTVCVGNVDQKGLDLLSATKEALDLGISVVKDGTPFFKIGETIENHAIKHGFKVDENFCGHGIGTQFHQPPLIYHYKNQESGIMRNGMIFTIEPILCQGQGGYIIWPDGWTAVSKDGGRSCQFEHTVLVTMDGCQILTL